MPKFKNNVARQLLSECLRDFCHDDCLYDEQQVIANALSDLDFPRNQEEYREFCKSVLCWVPGEGDDAAQHDAVIGVSWGDESKGRVVHALSKQYDWVIRFNGGANSGHTIFSNGKKYVHHLIPSADFTVSHIKAFLGSGMVIDLDELYNEIINLRNDFPDIASRIYIDPGAFIVSEKHKEIDRRENQRLGTTNRGIGPAYVDKYSRRGTRVYDLFNERSVKQLLDIGVQFKHSLELKNEFCTSNCLFEGAQSVLLDINVGQYPYVSCSDATISGIGASGFNFLKINDVYGISKCYTTKVGTGPFPTEIFDPILVEKLRTKGLEFGATTGRPRRIGWLDLPALKYACIMGGVNKLIVAKLDILTNFDTLAIATTYDGKSAIFGPTDFDDAKPIYTNLPCWQTNDFSDQNVIDFVNLIRNYVGVPVVGLSFSPKDDLIFLDNH